MSEKNKTNKSKNTNLMYLIVLLNSILVSLIGFLGWKVYFSGEEDFTKQSKDDINKTNNKNINSLKPSPTISKNSKLIGKPRGGGCG